MNKSVAILTANENKVFGVVYVVHVGHKKKKSRSSKKHNQQL